MKRVVVGMMLVTLATSCTKEAPRNKEALPSSSVQTPAPPPPKPRPTIDPKSSEAAEELVRAFVRLLNGGRLNDAHMLLGPTAPPRSEFDRRFSGYSDLRVTSGAAGDQEGAAGSIYVSVPLTISGELRGQQVRQSATAVLRRVNEVPGSTEAQRRWHIERIDWKDN